MGNYRPVYIIISYMSKPSWSTYIQTLLAPSSKSNTEMKLRIGTARQSLSTRGCFERKPYPWGYRFFVFCLSISLKILVFSLFITHPKKYPDTSFFELPYPFRIASFQHPSQKSSFYCTSFLRFSFVASSLTNHSPPTSNRTPLPRKVVSLHRKEVDHCSGQAFEVLSHQSCHLLQAGSAVNLYLPPLPFRGRQTAFGGIFF